MTSARKARRLLVDRATLPRNGERSLPPPYRFSIVRSTTTMYSMAWAATYAANPASGSRRWRR